MNEAPETMERLNALLLDMSARYIDLSASGIDPAIESDLGEISRLIGADRCTFNELLKDREVFHPSYVWWRPEDDAAMQQYNEWFWENAQIVYEAYRFLEKKWRRGEAYQMACLEDLPPEAGALKNLYTRYAVKSSISVPLLLDGRIVGSLAFSTVEKTRVWPEMMVPVLQRFGELIARVLTRKRSEEVRQKAFSRIKDLSDRIRADYMYLQEEIRQGHNSGEIVGRSRKLQDVLALVREVAMTDATVLILGETGTGKELVARAVHQASRRQDRPLVRVNCTTLPATMIESELFGHERGAFTGAVSRQVGRFELADGATLFLDEIGDLPLDLQPKLLRAIQNGEFERLGSGKTHHANVRIVAATNRNLEEKVKEGSFREDLWYRLNVFPVKLPPLRERKEDISLLVSWFAAKIGGKMGKQGLRISSDTLDLLMAYDWPGNVRELENLVERAIITSRDGQLNIELPGAPSVRKNSRKKGETLDEVAREHIIRVLNDAGWVIEGPNGAANFLNINPSTLRYRIRKLGIRRPRLAAGSGR